jgi:hypothetical protein
MYGEAARVQFLTEDQHRPGHPHDRHVETDDDADPEVNLEYRSPEKNRLRAAEKAAKKTQ